MQFEAKMKAAAIYKVKRSVVCVETGVVYDSSADAARKTDANAACIRSCCKGLKRTSRGYHWKYA